MQFILGQSDVVVSQFMFEYLHNCKIYLSLRQLFIKRTALIYVGVDIYFGIRSGKAPKNSS